MGKFFLYCFKADLNLSCCMGGGFYGYRGKDLSGALIWIVLFVHGQGLSLVTQVVAN